MLPMILDLYVMLYVTFFVELILSFPSVVAQATWPVLVRRH